MIRLTFETHSEEDTRQLGARFATALSAHRNTLVGTTSEGLTVALNGELGAGKTQFVRAVCEALGVPPDRVNSPTFVLLQTYVGDHLSVAHFDTYRLGDVDEFLAIGAEEYLLGSDMLCFVEWADRFAEVLPADRLIIDIEHTGEMSRRFEFAATGPSSSQVVNRM